MHQVDSASVRLDARVDLWPLSRPNKENGRGTMKISAHAVRRRSVLAGAAGALVAPAVVSAQGTYPNRPVRYINPYPAGGPPDTLSRMFCSKMSELTGPQWI